MKIKQYDASSFVDLNVKEFNVFETVRKIVKYHQNVKLQSLDLRKLKELERIVIGSFNFKQVMIEGLTNLKELEIIPDQEIYDIKEIPSSVTKLILTINLNDETIQHIVNVIETIVHNQRTEKRQCDIQTYNKNCVDRCALFHEMIQVIIQSFSILFKRIQVTLKKKLFNISIKQCLLMLKLY